MIYRSTIVKYKSKYLTFTHTLTHMLTHTQTEHVSLENYVCKRLNFTLLLFPLDSGTDGIPSN